METICKGGDITFLSFLHQRPKIVKYKVQVGEEFDVVEVETNDSSQVIVVYPPAACSPKQGEDRSSGSGAKVAAITLYLALVVPAAAYGIATGDFDYLKAIAEYGRDVAGAVAGAILPPPK